MSGEELIKTLITMYIRATNTMAFSWKIDRNTMISVTVEKVEVESEEE